MSCFDICVMVSMCALAMTAVYISYKANRILRDERDALRERLDESESEAYRLRKRLEQALEDAKAAQIESDDNEKSAMGLRMRRGNSQMAKVYDCEDRLVATLSETYLYKAFGVRRDEYDGCIVDIFVHKGRRNRADGERECKKNKQ